MVKEKVIFVLLLIALIVPSVFAVSTDITVETYTYHKVSVFVLQADQTYSMIESFHKDSGPEGKVTVTSAADYLNIDVLVNVKKDGQIVITKRFEDLATGSPIELELPERNDTEDDVIAVENVTAEANTTAESNVTTNITAKEEVSEDSNSSLSGNVVSNLTKPDWFKTSYLVYGIIGLVVVGAIIFIIKKGIPGNILASFSDPNSKHKHYSEGDVKKLQKKINNLESEIGYMKKKDEIAKAEGKLRQDREYLDRLKRGS